MSESKIAFEILCKTILCIWDFCSSSFWVKILMWLKATKIYTKCYIAASNIIFYLLLFHFTQKFKYSINYCSCYLWANDLVNSQKASQKTKCSHMQRNAETNFKLRFSSSYMQSTTLNMINAIRLKTTTPTRSILSTFS